jgi:hypothetical protein
MSGSLWTPVIYSFACSSSIYVYVCTRYEQVEALCFVLYKISLKIEYHTSTYNCSFHKHTKITAYYYFDFMRSKLSLRAVYC